MGSVSGGAALPTVRLARNVPEPVPDGAAVTFTLGAGEDAEPGSLALYRRPAVAALAAGPAAYVGVDVAAAGPAQVALLSELNDLRAVVNDLRAVVEGLRTVLNRSYLRDDPAAYSEGADVALNKPVSLDGTGTIQFGTLPEIVDGLSPSRCVISGDGGFAVDLGAAYAVSSFRLHTRDNGDVYGTAHLIIEGRRFATDPWTTLVDETVTESAAGYVLLCPSPGPWAYVRARMGASGRTGSAFMSWVEFEVRGGVAVTGVTFAAAPTAAERLLADLVRNR